MSYFNTKNIVFMIVLFLVMIATFYYALSYENNSNHIYTNVNGYEIAR